MARLAVLPGCLAEACFWLRGLVPSGWTHVDPATDELQEVSCPGQEGTNASDALETSHEHFIAWYSDGSGGEHAKDARRRRVGRGAVFSLRTGDQNGEPDHTPKSI